MTLPVSAVERFNASLHVAPLFSRHDSAGHRWCRCVALVLALLLAMALCAQAHAAPSPIGTGRINDIALGALSDPAKVNRKWPGYINYDIDLATWKYDVYVPAAYDGSKPYGLVVYTSSNNTGAVLEKAATERNLIWIAPRNVGNSQALETRHGASLLAFYRAMELFNIDPRRVYSSGLSGGARTASALAFLHSELIRGTAPSSGLAMPRLDELLPDYIPQTSTSETYYGYAAAFFDDEDIAKINAEAVTRGLRSYLITRHGDWRKDFIIEPFHAAYEPQGLTAFLHDGPGGHQDASDTEMIDAIDYLDRDDTFPVDARPGNQFATLADISQRGAQAATTASAKRLQPARDAVAAVKSSTGVYWANRNGSTFRWMWDLGTASPQNQKSVFGVWSGAETWNGGVPNTLAAARYPGILIALTQTSAGNRIVISARPDSGGETVFYDGGFKIVPAVATAQSGGTGYLAGSPVEIRLELSEKRFQIDFNGIALDETSSVVATGTQVEPDHRRSLIGEWDAALGVPFWKRDAADPEADTWSPSGKSLFTATTGAFDAAGAAPVPMDLRYVLISDPGLSPAR